MKTIFSVTFCVFISFSLFGTSYYVSNSGSNSNDGLSSSFPFLTLQFAADIVLAGDIVFVANGTYVGFDLRNKNGTVSNPIVFMASGNNVLINQSGPLRDDGINIENADYIEIDGFKVNGMTGGGNGIRLVLSDNCVVRNCSCDSNAERGIFTGFTDDILIEYNVCTNSVDEHGIYVSNSSDRPIIRYNECYGNNNTGIHINGDLSAGGDGIISDAQIYGNIIRDNNLAAGLNMDGVEHPIIYNNLIYNNHFGQGISMFQIDGAIATHGARIYNNTIIVPSDGRWGILMTNGANVDTEIYNNIIINHHAWRGCISAEATNQLSSNYNIVNDKLSNAGDGSTISLAQWQTLGLDLNSQIAGSLGNIFQNFGLNDFSLVPGSQATDIGTNLVSSVVQTDFAGTIRPSGTGFDIGAYEYESALPVDIFDFNAYMDIKLEHSTDVKSSWRKLEFISSIGSSGAVSSYEYLHRSPKSNLNFYRLKNIFLDGEVSYSNIESVFLPNKADISIFPNPANLTISIKGCHTGFILKLFDLLGKEILHRKAISDRQELDLRKVRSGTYFVTIQNTKGEFIYQNKLFIQ
jgi:parallel beta-helix repeat protein